MPVQILSAGCGIQHPLRHSDNPHGLYPYRGLPAFALLSMAGSGGSTSTARFLRRVVDKAGQTVDFLLTAHRDKKAALRFFRKALRQHGAPEKVSIDKSGANTAALKALQEETGATIEIRQNKYLNNLVEQDHRAVKRIVRPTLGFKSFWSARRTLAGIELMHMLKKGQMLGAGGQKLSAADQFYSLAA